MTTASLLADVGPCDDSGHFYINGNEVVSTTLDATQPFMRDLQDGAYNFRLEVINGGGWAWEAQLRLLINGTELISVKEVGGSGFYAGRVYDREWQCTIVNGQVSEFLVKDSQTV